MFSALGFLRFSCSLLIDCFVKPKRKGYPGGGRTSDSDDEDYKPTKLVGKAKPSPMKKGVKCIVRVLPPRPVEKPYMSLFSYFMNYKRQKHVLDVKIPTFNQEKVEAITKQGLDQVKRRQSKLVNKPEEVPPMLRTTSCHEANDKPPIRFQLFRTPSISVDIESQGSLSSDDYPCDSVSCVGSDFAYADELDIDNLYTPRTSHESASVNKLGVNPTFFNVENAGEYDEEEEDNSTDVFENSGQRNPIRRIHSVVERNETLRGNAQKQTNQNLLLNPAYGSLLIEKEEGEETEDDNTQTQTKMKSLKSVVKDGCKAPSGAIVENKYIGHTALNPTYGDLSSTCSDTCSESASSIREEELEVMMDEVPTTPMPLVYSPTKYGDFLEEDNCLDLDFKKTKETSSSKSILPSIPIVALEKVSVNTEIASCRMGTLTWRNIAFSESGASEDDAENDDEFEESNFVAEDLYASWSKPPSSFPAVLPSPFDHYTTSLSSRRSSFADSSSMRGESLLVQSTDQSSFRTSKSLQRQLSSYNTYKSFEDIDLHSRDCIPETYSAQISDHSQSSKEEKDAEEGDLVSFPPSLLKASKGSSNKASRFVAAGVKQTRSALRSLRLLLGRFDMFGQTLDKQK